MLDKIDIRKDASEEIKGRIPLFKSQIIKLKNQFNNARDVINHILEK